MVEAFLEDLKFHPYDTSPTRQLRCMVDGDVFPEERYGRVLLHLPAQPEEYFLGKTVMFFNFGKEIKGVLMFPEPIS